jgi:leucyl/phenylalanyl-tRNA--protein transferase
MSFLRRVRRSVFDHSKEAYRFFLNRGVIRLFGRPDVAVSTAFRATFPGSEPVVASALCGALRAGAPSPEKVIAGYCQGLVLTGRHGTDDLVWTYIPERAVITKEAVRVPREMQRLMNRGRAEIRRNQNFGEVLDGCRRENWSWITDPFVELYTELAEMGLIECFEAHCDGELVAGAWGLVVGDTLFGMSAFHTASRMGNVLWGVILTQLQDGEFDMIDCGEMKPLFARFGAEVVPHEVFIQRVVRGVIRSTRTDAYS